MGAGGVPGEGGRATAPAPARLHLHLFGGFQILRDGRPIEANWRTEKARGLTKLLALAPGHRLTREQIFDALWPDLDPRAAANNLYFALHAARRVLDTPGATTSLPLRKGVVALDPPGGLATDVAAFEGAAAGARRGDNPAAYEAALALYTGDLLPEDRYEDWSAGRREALREARLDLTLRLARARAARGEPEAALAAFEEAIALDSVSEEAHAEVMRLLAGLGRREAALRQYGRLRAALRDELDVEPGPATQALYAAILAGRAVEVAAEERRAAPVPAPGAPRDNLPVALTSFVGREREIAEVRALLKPDTPGERLVSLVGAGGCGKTRLALAVATGLRAGYPDGVWLVELAALADPARLPDVVAAALGVREVPGRPMLATLGEALRPLRLLLVLDNCEHVVDAAAELAVALLRACPALRVLATSREALRVPGERVWRVPSLSLPDEPTSGRAADAGSTLTAVERSEAAQLLLARVRQRRPGFALSVENAPAVATICRRLDGIPLALELAAARVDHLALGQIAARLDDALRLLTSGERGVAPRHRTLRATLDWSYRLLPASEARLFRRLAPFAGGCTLEAAEAVCRDDPAVDPADAILDGLAALADRSLVGVDEVGGSVRYRLLETTRQYASEALRASGEADAIGSRHARHFLALAEEAAPELRGSRQTWWFGRLARENDNLRAALARLIARPDADGALRLCAALGWFWAVRWQLAEGLEWCRRALALPGTAAQDGARAGTLFTAGQLARRLGDPPAARAYYTESLALARAAGDPLGTAWAALGLSILAQAGDRRAARAHAEEALALFQAAGYTPGLGYAHNALGELARLAGDQAAATSHYEARLALDRALDNRYGIALATYNLGFVVARQGEVRRAARLLLESIALSLEIGSQAAKSSFLDGAAAVASAAGQPALVARFSGAAQALIESLGRPGRDGADQLEHEHHLARARAALGPAAFAAAWDAGYALALDAALDEARQHMEMWSR